MNIKKYVILPLAIGFFVFGLLLIGVKAEDSVLSNDTIGEQDRLEIRSKIEELKQKRDVFIENMRSERELLKVKIETERKQLQTALAKIKDNVKRTIVEKIDDQLDKLNEKMLNHYSNVLDKLEDMLKRLSDRAAKDSEKGMDISAITALITEATAKISAARTAIEAQVGKTYPIKVAAESKLKADVGNARKLLHDDLVKVRDTVFAARDAVHRAIVELGQLHDVTVDKELPTPTVSISPSPIVSPSPSLTPTPSAS